MIFKCFHKNCGQDFEILENAHTAICPKCKTKYVRNNPPEGMISIRGTFIRKNPKIKMSKKQRLKIRRLKNENNLN
jgi:hypothetical protein